MASRPPATLSAGDIAQPLASRGSLPLRVAVYGVIAAAIRNGTLPSGALLPPEAELGAAFEVSRTVMREALILLEEDGLIRTQRGVGRFVADRLPEIGVEVLQPIEKMLKSAETVVAVRHVATKSEPVTDFTGRWLALRDGRCRMWESVVTHDDEPVALAQEWTAEGDEVASAILAADEVGHHRAGPSESMLSLLQRRLPSALGPAMCHISMTNAGADRAQLLQVRQRSALLLLTQTVAYEGHPFFVAKVLIRPEAAHLTVVQG